MVETQEESPSKVEDSKAPAGSIQSIREMHSLSTHIDGSGSPFKKLPSLIAIALIMSYYGFSNKVKFILNLISKKGRIYFENH